MMSNVNLPLLFNTAEQLGNYIIDSEFDNLCDLVVDGDLSFDCFAEFEIKVKNYMYYNAVVCFSHGDEEKIAKLLKEAYEELSEL